MFYVTRVIFFVRSAFFESFACFGGVTCFFFIFAKIVELWYWSSLIDNLWLLNFEKYILGPKLVGKSSNHLLICEVVTENEPKLRFPAFRRHLRQDPLHSLLHLANDARLKRPNAINPKGLHLKCPFGLLRKQSRESAEVAELAVPVN